MFSTAVSFLVLCVRCAPCVWCACVDVCSFFCFFQGGNQAANDTLETRKKALTKHANLLVSLKSHKANLLLAGHAVAINSVLCQELCEYNA